MTNDQIYVILALCALIISILGLILGATALIHSLSMAKTTHSIQYVPVDQAIDEENEAFLKSQWATKDSAIDKQNAMFKEDLKETMPILSSEDTEEVVSF